MKANNKQPTHSNAKKSTSPLFTQCVSDLPSSTAQALLQLRTYIFDTAQEHSDIGELSEVLRWGELSYLTEATGAGTMIRLAVNKQGEPALFFHCGTSLIESYRAQYTHIFKFEGNRALVIPEPVQDYEAELKHCIYQALTYKLKK
ncbi:MAG: DUF1801 domain-containing protein [Gammaproteobacteria bacterium]|nr:DUF1801 domain-containing protein [Gammaproteobacteria bacterium]